MSNGLTLTTYLELTTPPAGQPLAPPVAGAKATRQQFTAEDYLPLYGAVGGPLGWDGRTLMTRKALEDLLAAPSTDIYVLSVDGAPAGYCEFNRTQPPDSELKYFGLVPAMQGRKLGPYLLDVALRQHWRLNEPRRIWLHTDTWDNPKAISVYQRSGFRIFAEHMLAETADDKDYKAAIGIIS